MKVTVCELHDDPVNLEHDWAALVAHVRSEASDIVLLPEMPFHSWFAQSRPFEAAVWQEVIASHDVWLKRLRELAPATVISSRPVNGDNCRLNQGFLWEAGAGFRAAHEKHYLPEEDGWWEASWYDRGDGHFSPIDRGPLRIGFLICTELWFMEHARAYGKAGAHMLVTPRATGRNVDKWLSGGRAAAVVSGAFEVSSNRVTSEDQPVQFGGQGWVIGPDGDVLGLTSRQHPFITVEIDLFTAEQAKGTYPRYVLD